jgi:hypothetical protein
MSRKAPKILFLLILLAAEACGAAPTAQVQPVAPPVTEVNTPMAATATFPPMPSDTLTPRVVPTPTLISTPTPGAVSITAVNGDLSIRSGPATDAIDTLKSGRTLPVYARSIQDGWLQVPLPSQPGSLGWVSSTTGFSRVDGYVLDLPLNSEVEWPFGAYVVNCTAHQLVAEPGDKVLPPVSAAPTNRVWFFPGLYKIYDAELQSRPEITQVKLFEHTQVSVISDGTGTKYTCP